MGTPLEQARERVLGAGRIDPALRVKLSEGRISKAEAQELRDKIHNTEELARAIGRAIDEATSTERVQAISARVTILTERLNEVEPELRALIAELHSLKFRTADAVRSLRFGLIGVGLIQVVMTTVLIALFNT